MASDPTEWAPFDVSGVGPLPSQDSLTWPVWCVPFGWDWGQVWERPFVPEAVLADWPIEWSLSFQGFAVAAPPLCPADGDWPDWRGFDSSASDDHVEGEEENG